jgi:2-polyprenyl-6-methoxyphenol hydroxylase-like FAD-dependent oxidoreductase
MQPKTILIIGGGIGGLTLARFLARDGHRVTIIERVKEYASQGQAIGFRGVGLQAMEALGLRARVEQTGSHPRASVSYTMRGERLREMLYSDHAEDVGGVVVTLRARLHAALYEDLPPEITVRFGLSPTAIEQDEAGVRVTLNNGETLTCELLVGADGANSTVRRLVLPQVQVLDYGVYTAMTIDTEHGLATDEVHSFYAPARIVILFPIGPSRVSVVIYQDHKHPAPPQDNTPEAWRPYLEKGFAHAAPQIRRVFAALKAGDGIYHDIIRMVPPEQAVAGRVAFVGDAGYCPSFFSGNGAGVATAAAYCLAKCLAKREDMAGALARYEALILPFVAEYQANAHRMRSLLLTRSPIANFVRETTQRFAPSAAFRQRARAHYRGDVKLADWVS